MLLSKNVRAEPEHHCKFLLKIWAEIVEVFWVSSFAIEASGSFVAVFIDHQACFSAVNVHRGTGFSLLNLLLALGKSLCIFIYEVGMMMLSSS